MSNSFSQGRTDGLKGLSPLRTDDPAYLEGHAAGKRRRNRGLNSNVKDQQRAAAKAMNDRFGVKFYRAAKRCGVCRTLNTKRNKASVCLHCLMKAERVTA
jgi:hypothetical protein